LLFGVLTLFRISILGFRISRFCPLSSEMSVNQKREIMQNKPNFTKCPNEPKSSSHNKLRTTNNELFREKQTQFKPKQTQFQDKDRILRFAHLFFSRQKSKSSHSSQRRLYLPVQPSVMPTRLSAKSYFTGSEGEISEKPFVI